MQVTKSVLAIAILLLTIGFAFGQKVEFDYDHGANFYKYKTFSWIKEPDTLADPFMKQRIIDGVNAQLRAKGLRLVDSNGDLGVAVHVATQEKQTLNTFYDGFAPAAPWGFGMGTTTAVNNTYTEGTIVADLFDAQTKNVVWRGTAVKDVSRKPEKEAKQVEKAIEKMFRHYPPVRR